MRRLFFRALQGAAAPRSEERRCRFGVHIGPVSGRWTHMRKCADPPGKPKVPASGYPARISEPCNAKVCYPPFPGLRPPLTEQGKYAK